MTRSRSAFASLVAVAAIVALALLPNLGPNLQTQNQGVEAMHARIRDIVPRRADEPLRPPYANVDILDGPHVGQTMLAYLEGPGGSQIVANYQPGDEVVVTITSDQAGQPYVAVSDRWRAPLLGGFILLFAIAVVLVGGARGLRALIALGLTIALILKVLIPLVIGGVAPVPLAVLTATTVTVITIVLTEGWSRTSGAAILGTAGALALTGLLAAAATALAAFTYSAGSDLAFVQTADGRGLDLRGLLLAAFILGGVGVLDDVTVTQAALVGSLAERGARGRDLIASALDVGRSHIAATVNTLFLAYIGAGLPLVVTILVSNQPAALVFNSEEVGTEVIRTVVGSLGIIAAVPFTTFVAAALVEGRTSTEPRRTRIAWLSAATSVIVLALIATAVVPLGQGRAALPAEQFGPSSAPGIGTEQSPPDNIPLPSDGPAASDEPAGSDEPTPSAAPDDPEILSPGESYLLSTDGESLELVVSSIEATKVTGGYRVTATVSYRNKGTTAVNVDPTAWSLLTSGGEDVSLRPAATDGLVAGDLLAGSRRSGRLVGTVKAKPADTFLGFTDENDVLVFVVPA